MLDKLLPHEKCDYIAGASAAAASIHPSPGPGEQIKPVARRTPIKLPQRTYGLLSPLKNILPFVGLPTPMNRNEFVSVKLAPECHPLAVWRSVVDCRT